MNQHRCLPYENSLLVRTYFSTYLELLVAAHENASSDIEGRFVKAAFSPEALERRLQRIEHLGLTSRILAEVGEIGDPVELDRRLTDVWAELRTLDQLLREGYTDIEKVTTTADFIARRDSQKTAFQVTHLHKLLAVEIEQRNPPHLRNESTVGMVDSVHERLDSPAGHLFWSRVEEKNGKFARWTTGGWSRRIVLVTNEVGFQDTLQRHIGCQQIRASIHDLPVINIEQFLWLPDDGNGAWFHVGAAIRETLCWADWKDALPSDSLSEVGQSTLPIERRQVDIDSDIPSWLKERN